MKLALVLSIFALSGCAANIQAGQDRLAAWKQEMAGMCNNYADEQSAGYQNPDVTRLEHRRAYERCIRSMLR